MKKLEKVKYIIAEKLNKLYAKRLNEQQSGSCEVHQPALQARFSAVPNPQLGDHGINQNFVNNMQGRPSNFYQLKSSNFVQKAIQLNGGSGVMLCKGKNPMWQAMLMNRSDYALNCFQNPGSC